MSCNQLPERPFDRVTINDPVIRSATPTLYAALAGWL
jgi:hypothetical protein